MICLASLKRSSLSCSCGVVSDGRSGLTCVCPRVVSQGRCWTSTRRCCRPSKEWTHRNRRSRPPSASPAAPYTSWPYVCFTQSIWDATTLTHFNQDHKFYMIIEQNITDRTIPRMNVFDIFTLCFVKFTVSLVQQEEVDAGAIVVQEAVPILVTDTEDSLSERIREAEHRAFPAALELVASGGVKLRDDGRVVWSQSVQG